MSNGTSVYARAFGVENPTPDELQQLQQYASDLSGSGFNTIINFALTVDTNGDLMFNAGSPMVSGGQLQDGFSNLPGLFSTIWAGDSVTGLMFSLGGWLAEGSYVNIGNLIDQYGIGSENPLYANFQVLLEQLSVNGIDFDLEAVDNPYSYYTGILVQLTQMLSNIGFSVITGCPYTEQDFWLDWLYQVYQNNGQQLASGWNLQCYVGGLGNTQSQWAAYIDQYQQNTGSLGIDDSSAFVYPGYSASDYCPGGIQDNFSNSSLMSPGITGGFIWSYSIILENQSSGTCSPNNATADWASAIVNGIGALSGGGATAKPAQEAAVPPA